MPNNAWTGTISDNKFKYEYTADQAQPSGYTLKLATENKFVDKDIWAKVIIPSGSLSKGSGTATLTNQGATGLLGTGTSSQPSSGPYIQINGKGSVKVGTAGWLAVNSTTDSNEAVQYFPVNSASFTAADGVVYCSQAGYVPQGSSTSGVYTVSSTTLSTTSTVVSGTTVTRQAGASWGTGLINADSITAVTFSNTFTGNDSNYVDISGTNAAPVLSSNGFLYINAGYTDNLKISLAKLIPDAINSTNTFVTAENMRQGYVAFDKDGVGIVGSMPDTSASTTFTNSGLSTYFSTTNSGGNVTINTSYTVSTAGYITIGTIASSTTARYNIKTTSLSATAGTVDLISDATGPSGTTPSLPFSIYSSSTTRNIKITTNTTTGSMGENRVYIKIEGTGAVAASTTGWLTSTGSVASTTATRYVSMDYYTGTYTT